MLIKSSSPFVVLWKSFTGWWENLITLALISSAWLACWLTVIFGPPATFGLFCAIHELVEENTTTFRTAFDGAKRYFLTSWVWMLANVLVIGLLVFNYLFYLGVNNTLGFAVQLLVLILLVFWIGVQYYAVPFYLLQEQKSLWVAWRNGALTALSSPLHALVIWVVILIIMAAGVVLVLPALLGIPALAALMGAVAVRERLITYGLIKPETFEKEEPDK